MLWVGFKGVALVGFLDFFDCYTLCNEGNAHLALPKGLFVLSFTDFIP